MTAVTALSADSLKLFCFNCSVSPPGGDFSDPVTSATLGIVQVSEEFLHTAVLSHWFIAE